MTGRQIGRSSPVLALVLVAALAALGALGWLSMRGLGRRAGVDGGKSEIEMQGGARSSVRMDSVERELKAGPNGAPTSAEIRPRPALNGRLHASACDARSAMPIHGLRLELVRQEGEPQRARSACLRADATGVIDDDRLPIGLWRITASAARHESVDLGVHELQPEVTLELGSIALMPSPVHRGRLTDASGQPAAGNTIAAPEHQPHVGALPLPAVTMQDGSFELVGEMPAKFVVQVNSAGQWGSFSAQRFALEAWPENEVKQLQLEVFQHVILNLYGSGDERLKLGINLCPEEGELEWGVHTYPDEGSHGPLVRARELLPASDARRFECFLAAGRYQVWGGRGFGMSLELRPGLLECEFALQGK